MESIHRNAKIGETLENTLDEMVSKNMITNHNKGEIFKLFDKVMLQIFKTNKNKITCKANLKDYQHCDNVWKFLLKDVKFSDEQSRSIKLMKIVALDYSRISAIEGQDKPKKTVLKQQSKKKK